MKFIMTILFLVLTLLTSAQKTKTYFPAWTFQQKNTKIYGISIGLWDFSSHPINTTTNGLRLSLVGEGIVAPMAPRSPIPENDSSFQASKSLKVSEYINGISLSGTGNAGDYNINGIALGFVGQIHNKVNGISAAAMINFATTHNGIQLAFHMNQSYCMNGIQIGCVNSSKRTRGIQIGLWNKNEKRKFPIINWNFSRT